MSKPKKVHGPEWRGSRMFGTRSSLTDSLGRSLMAPTGTIITVPDNLTHDDAAIRFGETVDSLLQEGWVRVMTSPGIIYLQWEHPLTAAQRSEIMATADEFNHVIIDTPEVHVSERLMVAAIARRNRR